MIKPLRLLWLTLVVLLGGFATGQAQTITTGAVSPTASCGGIITVPFTVSNGTLAAGTSFKVQISGPNGATPFTDVSNAVGTTSPLSASVAASTVAGETYTFRVTTVSSMTGLTLVPSSNSVNLAATPTATPTMASPPTYCQFATASPLSATAATSTVVNWYNVPTGGTVLATGNTGPTPPTTTAGTFTYYAALANTNGCEGPRASVTVTVNAQPTPPTATSPVTYCQNDAATALTATGQNLLWYTTSTGGTGSATAPTPPTSTTGTTNYYVSQTVNGCTSDRATISVTINPIPSLPTVSGPVTYCQNTTATALTATASNNGTLLWYTSSSGGTGSTVAPIPSTSSVGTTTYYVSQRVNNCESARAAITVTINAQPAQPSVQPPVTYCQNATATPLSATALSGNSLRWYGTSATGGTASTTAPTPVVTTAGSFTYYVSQVNTSTGCESPRGSIAVTVNATPTAPTAPASVSYCQGATASPLSATAASGGTLNWYTTPTSGTATATAPTPPTSTTGTNSYYVSQTINSCEGPRATITVTIRPLPTAPTTAVTSLTYCQNQTVAATPLSATASAGGTLTWYLPGGTTSATAPTPVLTTAGTQSFSVSQTINGCAGPLVAIDVTIKPQPALPTVPTSVTICENATPVPLAATALTGGTLNWYGTSATGGSASATAPSPATTPVGTTTYYVSQTGPNGCESGRASIPFTVKIRPLAPTVTDLAYCQTSATQPLTATPTGTNTLSWYGTSATGGTASATPPTPPSTAVGTVTYYVSQTQDGCEGPRAGLAIRIKPLPVAPGVADLNLCQFDETRPVTATGQNLRWFNNFGDPFPTNFTPSPNTAEGGTVVYQVSQTVEACEGPRATLTVNIRTTPLPLVSSPVVYCQNANAQPLSATGVQGGRFVWTDPYGNVTEVAPVPPTLNATTGEFFYKVAQIGPNGCKSANVNIRYIVNPPPTASVNGPTSVNLGMPVSLTLTFTSVPPFSYTLSDGSSGVSETQQRILTVTPTQSTIYRVTSVTNVCGLGLPGTNANVTVRIPTITTAALTAGTVCAGTQIQVGFTFTGEFNPGNAFRVQMARDTAFSSPIDISPGTPTAGIITATVPTTATQGLYFVRVLASNPSVPVPGRRSPTVLDVRALPVATLTGPRDIFEGQSAQLSFQFTGDGPWQVSYNDSLRTQSFQTNANPHLLTVTPARTTTYRLTAVSNNCGPGTANGTATIRVLPVLGLEPNPLHTAVRAYPVPVSQELTVEIDTDLQAEPTTIRLVDGNGRPALQTTTRQRQQKLDLSQQPSGLYFLHVQVGDHTTVRKVVKQ